MTEASLAARSRVYFVQNIRSGAVKIGYSTDVSKRISSLQTSSDDRLVLIRLIDGGPRTEAWLHKRFATRRIRGEWFDFNDDMLAVCPPDEVPQRHSIIQRRDVRLTLRERTKEAERLGDEIGLTAKQVLFSISSGVSDEEAKAVLEFMRGGVSE